MTKATFNREVAFSIGAISMNIISVNEQPAMKERVIAYFQQQWAAEKSKRVYEDCITYGITSARSLPLYLMTITSLAM